MQEPPTAPTTTSEHTGETNSPRPVRIRSYIAWIAIVATVMIISGVTLFLSEHEAEIGPQMSDAVTEFQGKYIVGAASMLPTSNDDLLANIDTSSGPIGQRLKNVVVVAELQGPEKARTDLEAIGKVIQEEDAKSTSEDRKSHVSSTDRDMLRILEQLYQEDTEPSDAVAAISDEDAAMLTESMGWFGQLALAPEGSDEATRKEIFAGSQLVFGITITGFMMVLGGGFLGLVGLVVLIINVANGNMAPRLSVCAADHRLYLETFAIWSVVMFAGQFIASMVAANIPEQFRLLPMAIVFFGTLATLAWPVFCGASFSDVRRDIGWTLPRPAWATPFYGIGGYMMGLPLVAVGVVLTFVLTFLSGQMANTDPLAPTNGPAHPIVMELGGNWLVILQVFILGSIAAPLVEETMFRGVLYRHLREASRSRRMLMSIVFSTLLNSFIFAAIHPQGLAAIPALMSLAIAFTIAREMLDSLVPAMIMHGFSNGVALALGLVLFG